MRKFTDTEIDLCKKIAEKERRKITKGDYYSYQDKIYLRSMPFMETEDVAEGIKILQEHDCLEFMREKGFRLSGHYDIKNEVLVSFSADTDLAMNIAPEVFAKGKTDLEALLRAVLAVMENK